MNSMSGSSNASEQNSTETETGASAKPFMQNDVLGYGNVLVLKREFGIFVLYIFDLRIPDIHGA